MKKSITRVRSVLLVDDDEDVLDSVRELLVSHGYVVAEARDGRQALDYLRDNQPPLYIGA